MSIPATQIKQNYHQNYQQNLKNMSSLSQLLCICSSFALLTILLTITESQSTFICFKREKAAESTETVFFKRQTKEELLKDESMENESANCLVQSFNFDMRRNLVADIVDSPTRKGKHCEYFATLENKLLQESDKLAHFIGKSISSENTRKLLKSTSSAAKLPVLNTKFDGRLSTRLQPRRHDSKYIERAKELVKKLKTQTHYSKEQYQKQTIGSAKQKYQHLRSVVYSICKPKKEDNHGKTEKTEANHLPQDQIQKSHKSISETQSLKDTVSTQSSKSVQIITEQAIPIFHQDGIKLDDFEPLRMLGRGRVGIVCLVKHKATGFLCALKQIPQSQLKIDKDQKKLLQRIRQIKIQSYLDHPHIVQLYSVFVEDNSLYLLMQLCSDGTIYDHLKRQGSFPQDKIRSVIKQVCYSVEYMHDNDILHRDIKPENILFHNHIVKLCDFGWTVHSPLLRDTLCGTPLYSSPEVAQKQQYDNKIDIWNIGILTYELAFGRVPFEIRNEDEVLKVVEEEIYFPRSKPASPEIKDFIMHCLSKNPKERFPIGKLIDHEFLNPREEGKQC